MMPDEKTVPQAASAGTAKKRRFLCKVCGYVYEGDELPADYVCPWCKKGPEAFEEIFDEEPASEEGQSAVEPAAAEDRAGEPVPEKAAGEEAGAVPKKKRKFLCKVCGYVYEGDELPADYVCPWCKKGPEVFVEIFDEESASEEGQSAVEPAAAEDRAGEPAPENAAGGEAEAAPKKKRKFLCKVCGYVYEGDELPADYVCPWCKKGPEVFEEIFDEEPAAEEKADQEPSSPEPEIEEWQPDAPTGARRYRCSVCGNIYEGEKLPEDYVCPFCRKGPEFYRLIEEKASQPAGRLAGTKTRKNLAAAFAAEALAASKNSYFSKAARDEGFEQIAEVFQSAAGNEMGHARVWFDLLGGAGTTADNLRAAADGDSYSRTSLYEAFAAEAESEGLANIAEKFRMAAAVKKTHEERFRSILAEVEAKRAFSKPGRTMWECRACGHRTSGTDAPEACPLCGSPKGFFQALAAGG